MRLIVRQPDEKEIAIHILGDEPIFLGRSKKNQIILPKEEISRKHAKIFKKDDQYWIEDLESINGTKLNGEVITKAPLNLGDQIEIGSFHISLEQEIEEISPEVSAGETLARVPEPEEGQDEFLNAISVRPKAETHPEPTPTYPRNVDLEETLSPSAPLSDLTPAEILPKTDSKLVRLDGPEAGKELPLTSSKITLGRSSEDDIPIEDDEVSQAHATLEKTEKGYVLHNNEDSTGTFVDGFPVKDRPLENHDVVQVGSARFEYVEPGSSSSVEKYAKSPHANGTRLKSQFELRWERWNPYLTDWKTLFLLGVVVGLILVWPSSEPVLKKEKPAPATPGVSPELTRVIRFNLDRAQKLISKSDFDAAEARIQLVLEKAPQNQEALKLTRTISSAKEAERQAREEAEKARKLKIKKMEGFLVEGFEQMKKQKFELAREAFRKAEKFMPEDSRVTGAFHQLKKEEEKIRLARIAKRKNDRELKKLYEQGVQEYETGNFGKAEMLLTEVASKKGHRYQASAQKLLNDVATKVGEDLQEHIDDARTLAQTGEPIQAYEALKNIIEKFPQNKEAQKLFGMLKEDLARDAKQYYQNGIAFMEIVDDREAATEAFRKALQHAPDKESEYHQKATKKLKELGIH